MGTMGDWYVYIVRCADTTLYTGIAKNVERRLAEHNTPGRPGARYTRPRRPVELVYKESCHSRAQAARREAQIKRLSRTEKQALVEAAASDPVAQDR